MSSDQSIWATIGITAVTLLCGWFLRAICDNVAKATGFDQVMASATHSTLQFMRRWMPISLLVLAVSVSSSLLTAWIVLHAVLQRT